MTTRRAFLAGTGAVLLVAPLVAGAQQARKIARLGYLSGATPAVVTPQVEAFRQRLGELGHVEGNTIVEVRYSEGTAERLPELARELVGLKMDVIVTANDAATAAVKRETQTIPIVMMNSIDPVGTGFVATLAHPGGNVTGLSNVSSELSGKRLELLRQVVPGLSRVAFLWNPDLRGAVLEYKQMEATAHSLGLELQSVEVSRSEDLDRAFSAVTNQHAQAFVLSPSPVTLLSRGQIASFAQRNRLPSIYGQKEYVVAGGLMSYGPSLSDQFRSAAVYVDKILKGARPGDLPVEQPTKFELVINLKTAKGLGLTIPQSVLGRADEVIQ